MSAICKPIVWMDEYGVYRVGATQVMLDSVLAGFLAGETPEYVQEGYPALSVNEVRAAIAHYVANREEIDAYLARQQALWDRLREEQERNPSPVVKRVRDVVRSAQHQPR